MSCGALIIGSKTEPVTEVIQDNKNGLLVDFFDSKMITKTITKVLNNRQKYENIRKNARKTIVEKYDLNNILLGHHFSELKPNKMSDVFKKFKERPWKKEGKINSEWVLIDFVNVVAHVFDKEKRNLYNLETLWGCLLYTSPSPRDS